MTNFNGQDHGTSGFNNSAVLASEAPNNSFNQSMPVVLTNGNNRTGVIDNIPFRNITATSRPLYRGFLSGSYVYSVGSPPGGGATDIVIVNTGESTYT